MAIRHWHPIKLGIIWFIDLALFLALWLLASPYSREDKAFVIVIWLIFSIPVFVLTWKWATGLQQAIGSDPEKQSDQSDSETLVKFRLFKSLTWTQAGLLILVAGTGALAGYWYKSYEAQRLEFNWMTVPENLDYRRVYFFMRDEEPQLTRQSGQTEGKSREKFQTTKKPWEEYRDVWISSLADKLVLKKLDTKVKFVPAPARHPGKVRIGYVASLGVGLGDLSMITEGDKRKLEEGKITGSCYFQIGFTLHDRDGFEIATLWGQKHDFRIPVEAKIYQDLTTDFVSTAEARRTTAVTQKTNIAKNCSTIVWD